MNAWWREQLEQHFFRTRLKQWFYQNSSGESNYIWIFYFFIQNQQCLIICTRLKRYVSYVRLSFIQSVHRYHPVRIPLVFKVQYFKCSFDVCFHRASGASDFHRHIKRMVNFSISFLIISPWTPRTFKKKPSPPYADASRTRRLLKGVWLLWRSRFDRCLGSSWH